MNLAFFDPINWNYDVGTPYERPLGGSQSAMCYLAVALAARGHAVTFYTATTRPRVYQDVNCRSCENISREDLAKHDAMISLNGPADLCLTVRPFLPARCRLILWTQHAHDQPAMFPLQRPEVRAGWDAIACVSQWHAGSMQRQYNLDPRRVAVLRNAIGPAFANLFPDAAALARAKSSAMALAYTSTPFRGLNLLLSFFPEIYRNDPRVQLRIYSSMKVYFTDESKDAYANLYAHSRSMPGVEYVGSLPQPALAQSLKSATILSYPNTFPETSCIAVMEAMAAGLLIVTSDLGALPETTMGMGVLTPGPRDQQEITGFMQAYAEKLFGAIGHIGRDPENFWAARWEQVKATTTQYTWRIRAAEWEKFLMGPEISP